MSSKLFDIGLWSGQFGVDLATKLQPCLLHSASSIPFVSLLARPGWGANPSVTFALGIAPWKERWSHRRGILPEHSGEGTVHWLALQNFGCESASQSTPLIGIHMVTDIRRLFRSTSVCIHHRQGIETQLDCGLSRGRSCSGTENHGGNNGHGGNV